MLKFTVVFGGTKTEFDVENRLTKDFNDNFISKSDR